MKIDDILEILPLNDHKDLYYRRISIYRKKIDLLFFSSIVDENEIGNLLKNIVLTPSYLYLKNRNAKVEKCNLIDEAIESLLDGKIIVLYNNIAYQIDLKKYPSRSIQEPEVEKTIRGSRDGFNEQIITNISLIRMRIKSSRLCITTKNIGKYSKTKIAIIYLNDIVDREILTKLNKRLDSIDLDSLIMTDRALEENIMPQRKTLFPLVRYTERPDVASIHLMNGKIIIIVDTSPSCIIVPISLFDHLKHVEEFRQNPIIGIFTKSLRFCASLISVFFIPTMYLMQTNDYQINVFSFYLQNEAFLPLSIQYILCTLVIELFRIAIVHTPNTLISALSIVIGIVFGEISLRVGIFVPEVLLCVAFSAVCNFAIPSYELSMTNKLVMICLLLGATFLGIEGYMILNIIFFIRLASIKVFGMPYLCPLVPFDLKIFKDKLLRSDASKKKKV